ncbi:helix-turn-helix domain-containing protein [Xanthomonas axonopodis]
MTIGERLKDLRTEHGLTQPQMAAIARTSKQYVSQLEKGANKIPNGQILEAWARHFGVNYQWLASGKGPRITNSVQEPQSPHQSQLLQIDPEILSAAIKLIRLTFRHLDVAHDPEEDGVPTALAYKYLLARQQTSVTSDNVVDFGTYLRKSLEEAGSERISRTRRVGEGHRSAGQRREAS